MKSRENLKHYSKGLVKESFSLDEVNCFQFQKLDQRFIEYRRLNRVKQEKEKEIAYQQQAFETHLREETEKVKKSQAEEIQRELEALRNKQNSLEQQLLEERKRRDEETLNLIMEKSREQLENQKQQQENLATAYQHALKTQLREETENVKKIHDEEFQRELEALRDRQTSLEQQLLEKINKRGEETLNLIMEKLREQLENQEKLQEKLVTEIERRYEDKFAYQQQLLEEEIRRRTAQIESEQKSRLHELEVSNSTSIGALTKCFFSIPSCTFLNFVVKLKIWLF